jgi:NADH:ubiquinone oxidoreductase subunit 4 (subunit M)
MDVDKDEKFLIYSSISSEVHLVDLATLYTKHEKLSFKIPGMINDGWGSSI